MTKITLPISLLTYEFPQAIDLDKMPRKKKKALKKEIAKWIVEVTHDATEKILEFEQNKTKI
jgi:hypothetical protein